MNLKSLTLTAALACALVGCVQMQPPPLAADHPAQPQAPASPEPVATPMLMAGSLGLVLPVSTNQAEMQHGQHEQAPATKGAQPSEHKHEHQPAKQEEKK